MMIEENDRKKNCDRLSTMGGLPVGRFPVEIKIMFC